MKPPNDAVLRVQCRASDLERWKMEAANRGESLSESIRRVLNAPRGHASYAQRTVIRDMEAEIRAMGKDPGDRFRRYFEPWDDAEDERLEAQSSP